MKIQCDVCEKSAATVICCADEAALCSACDVEVHAANKLASKHQRLLLEFLSNNLPPCDICREKAALVFCVEDRVLLCKDCDGPLHSANTLAANHCRYLTTAIRVVALSSNSDKESSSYHQMEPRTQRSNSQPITWKVSRAVDELLQFSDSHTEELEFSKLEQLTDINLFSESLEALSAAEAPEVTMSLLSNINSYRTAKPFATHNKSRIEISVDDEEHYTVPDLGCAQCVMPEPFD